MADDNPDAPDLSAIQEAMRKATLEGMKDYDREREAWEAAVKANEPPPPVDDKPKKGSLTELLLSGKRTPSE